MDWLTTAYYAVKGEAQILGPLLILVGLVFAWVLPLRREARQRKRQDAITIRGLLVYIDVLLEKVGAAIAKMEEVHQARAAFASEATEENRKWKTTAEQTAMGIGNFDADNKENHLAIERLFTTSSITDPGMRKGVLAFLIYLKLSPAKRRLTQFKEYERQLSAVAAAIRPASRR